MTTDNESDVEVAEPIRALIDLTTELTDVIERENELLRARRPREIAPLQADKARLAATYATAIRAIADDRSALSALAPTLIDELRAYTVKFEERAAEQRALLDGARTAGEGVVKAVAAAAAAPAAGGYGSPGTGAGPVAVAEDA